MADLCLEGKKAAVTGASKGIGAAAAIALAEAGADVLLVSRDKDKTEAVASRVRALGRKCEVFLADVGDAAQTARFGERIEAFGGIDIYVNNAGYTVTKTAMETSADEARALFDVNFFGSLAMTRAAARHMLDNRKNGAITFVTSINAISALPKQALYSCTKAALESLIKSLAAELSPRGIRVNSVAPGAILTDMNSHLTPADIAGLNEKIPLGIGSADEIADVIVFLSSDAARYITGSTIVADGGYLLRDAGVKKP